MKKIVLGIFASLMVSSCGPVAVTYPPNSVLCKTDWDCPGMDTYCGFVPGYTAAVCKNSR